MDKVKKTTEHSGHRKRLRARLLRSLSIAEEYELIEAVLMYAQPRKDMKPQAKAILKKFSSIHNMAHASSVGCEDIEGIGKNISWYCSFLSEVGKRFGEGYDINDTQKVSKSEQCGIEKSEDIIEYLRLNGVFTEKTALWIICLNASRKPVRIYPFDFRVGTKEFLKLLLDVCASSIILVRKVDAEEYTIDSTDIELLRKRERGLVLFDITVLDYIICTHSEAISLSKFSILSF